MLANDFLVSLGQAATPSEQISLNDVDNLPDMLYQSLLTNVTSCRTHDRSEQQFVYNETSSHLIIYHYISS